MHNCRRSGEPRRDWMKLAIKNYDKMHKDSDSRKHTCDTCEEHWDEDIKPYECLDLGFTEEGICEGYIEHEITICDYCDNGCKFYDNQCPHFTNYKETEAEIKCRIENE